MSGLMFVDGFNQLFNIILKTRDYCEKRQNKQLHWAHSHKGHTELERSSCHRNVAEDAGEWMKEWQGNTHIHIAFVAKAETRGREYSIVGSCEMWQIGSLWLARGSLVSELNVEIKRDKQQKEIRCYQEYINVVINECDSLKWTWSWAGHRGTRGWWS